MVWQCRICTLLVKFFNFVDVDGDNCVEISELDAARSYLGLPPLEKADKDSLANLCNGAVTL